MSARDYGQKPAHPFAQTSETFQFTGTQHTGLTLRETAAIATLQGLLAKYGVDDMLPGPMAEAACNFADALTARLAKGGAA